MTWVEFPLWADNQGFGCRKSADSGCSAEECQKQLFCRCRFWLWQSDPTGQCEWQASPVWAPCCGTRGWLDYLAEPGGSSTEVKGAGSVIVYREGLLKQTKERKFSHRPARYSFEWFSYTGTN